ncbi:ComF family protein [Algoriphagus aquimarinus]|uniref:ComF family protein n=1 Tax=Algoriphagus aquimarinus TaxID=237018 RepID=UPI0030D9B8AA|tara:strand:- start:273877 stop:274569 length:693 start_codon:yes stop_codon:yes gene_type:complete
MRLFFVKDFLDLVFPRNCLLCGRSLYDHENNLCTICKGTLPITSYHLRPIDNDLCDKVKGLSTVGMVMAYLKFTKGGNSQKLLHQLKYRNKPQLAKELGSMYGKILNDTGFDKSWDMIVPVPLHPLKQSRRGYNQSEQFGLGLSQSLSVKLENALIRGKFTETQTQKSRLQRMDNMDEVFQISPYASISDKSILLVDDVMTTGATLCACANVLLANGAKNVDLVTIAAGG